MDLNGWKGSTSEFIGFLIAGLLLLAFGVFQVVGISTRGQTLGKRVMGVRIVRVNGASAGFYRGFLLRSFVGGLPGAIPFLGTVYYIVDALFIFRADHRCIHDMIGGTCVVRV